MKVLGIESTAHTLGVGLLEDGEVVGEAKDMFQPEQGGIHPRKAAEHHYSEASRVFGEAFSSAGFSREEVDAVAFAQGPGIGQCLDIGGVAARTLAQRADADLIGVNHPAAHITVGKQFSEADRPVTLYVSGGNSQVIVERNGRYSVVGETLDIALGNAVDKLARSMGVPHPGGPRIEELASQTDELLEIAYPVKGMDFSFSGIVTELQKKVGDAPDPVIANTFQEHAYAATVEALERAMALTDSEEALLTGGVAVNNRLREMVETMCGEREARAYFPPEKYCMDNGTMIAYRGLKRLEDGEKTGFENSSSRPDWRIDGLKAY